MQSEFISLLEAEKVVSKSRATLVRLCHKFERVGDAIKDDAGQWLIKRDALINHYNVAQRKESAKESQENANMVQWLQSRVETLEERVKELIYSNQSLIQENKKLKELQQPQAERVGDRRYLITVIALLIVVVALVYLITNF